MIKEMTLEITQLCLNDCIYCSSCSNSKTDKNNMNVNIIYEVLEDAANLGIKELNLSGGEPFLHKNIIEIIDRARLLGLEVTIYSSGLCSNGIMYLPIPDNYINRCKELGVKKIVFNMQSYNDEIHKIITNGELKQSIRDKSIQKCINSGIDTEINIVPMKINMNEIMMICDNAINLGCNKINLLGLVMQGRCNNNKEKIIMSKEDVHLLKHGIIPKIKEKYGDKIRVGSPLSENSSTRCNAISGRISIRYDGYVFPCEAWKHCDRFDDYKPLNVYKRKLSQILQTSHYLKSIKNYIDALKDVKCSECPAQKQLGFDCAVDLNNTTDILPEYMSVPSQNSDAIFESYMKGLLSSVKEELYSQYTSSDVLNAEQKIKFIELNYLSCNKKIVDNNKNIHLLSSKESNTIKGFAIDPINISKELFDNMCKGKLPNMRKYECDSTNDKNVYLFNEPYVDEIVSLDARTDFYKRYLTFASYPINNYFKYSIAVSLSEYFYNVLEEFGFVEIYKNDLFAVMVYVVPPVLYSKNILKFNLDL